MKTVPSLTHERLLDVLFYDTLLGKFYWRISKSNRVSGSIAGGLGSGGYVAIRIDGAQYLAHRLAWFYIHAEWPDRIDHINGSRSDNRLANLREASPQENACNARKASAPMSSGYKGVCWDRKNNKWIVHIKRNGKNLHLGRFSDERVAAEAYDRAAAQFHGAFARLNFPKAAA